MARGNWKYNKGTPLADIIADIGYARGDLPNYPVATFVPEQLSALRYICRWRLGLSTEDCTHWSKMREAYNGTSTPVTHSDSAEEDDDDTQTDDTMPAPTPALPVPAPDPAPRAPHAEHDLVNALRALMPAPALDEEAIKRIVTTTIAEHTFARPVKVIFPQENITRDMGLQHHKFDTLLKAVAAGVNVWLAGPAGSGKTSAAESVAKALDMPFTFNGAVDNEYKLTGFVDAQGRIVSRPFRESYQNGGLHLFDEVDGSFPGALLAFNAAIANKMMDFPDGIIKMHPDFRVIAAANTFGGGGTIEYVGRMRQDAAFLDRFAFINWPIDEELERATCSNPTWCTRVQTLRTRAAAKGMKVSISPRATYYGEKLLAAGLDQATVEDMTIFKGMTDEQKKSIA